VARILILSTVGQATLGLLEWIFREQQRKLSAPKCVFTRKMSSYLHHFALFGGVSEGLEVQKPRKCAKSACKFERKSNKLGPK
jgi:hypothetical protein